MRLVLFLCFFMSFSSAYVPGIGYEQLSNDVFWRLADYYKSSEHVRLLPYLKRRLPFPQKSLNQQILSQLTDLRRINY